MGGGVGRSHRLTSALAALAERPVDGDSGLLDDLPMDAALARAVRGELELLAHRLLRLTIHGDATVAEAVQEMALLREHPWDRSGRAMVEEILDAWWSETLHLGPGEHRPGLEPSEVLGVLVGYEPAMVRWLDPWLTGLDGQPAVHLVDMVVDGIDGPAWAGKRDEAEQVVGWARTEPVVNGLILIGGSHVDADRLSAALDLLI